MKFVKETAGCSERFQAGGRLKPGRSLVSSAVVVTLAIFLVSLWPEVTRSQPAPPIQPQEISPDGVQPSPLIKSKSKPASAPVERKQLIALDFNNVDLAVFVKFIGEIVGKNFIIDERVRGKVTIFSPAKISVDKVYDVFLSVLALKGFAAVTSGEVIQILPVAEAPTERDIHVYYLENANAEEIAKLLTKLVTQRSRPRSTNRQPRRPGAVQTSQGKAQGEFQGDIQIIPDKSTNGLLITASKKDYEMLKLVIRKLDVRRRQVYVEAVIMEVGQDRLRELGTELGIVGGYQTSDQRVSGIGGFNQAPEDIAGFANITGFDVGLSTINATVLLKALQDTSDVNVLSTPQILVLNNQKAKIVVAQNVPFVTGTSQSPGAVTQRQIQRQDVGVTLEITPQILEGDRVRMDIRQEISSLVDTPQDVLVELGPTTNKREATTTIIVSDRQTVVIGGLIRDDETRVIRKIPLLGDIPLLGWFFKFKSKRIIKSNLLIFLTPYIVHEPQDLDDLRDEKGSMIRQAMSKKRSGMPSLKEQFLDRINPPKNAR